MAEATQPKSFFFDSRRLDFFLYAKPECNWQSIFEASKMNETKKKVLLFPRKRRYPQRNFLIRRKLNDRINEIQNNDGRLVFVQSVL
jgi:hypothetical protein